MIDTFDATSSTPTLSILQPYDAVFVWANSQFSSAAGIGDVLGQYWDAGGAVVPAMMSLVFSCLQGRFGSNSNGYMLIDGTASNNNGSSASLGTVVDPGSPLVSGVSALSAANAWCSTGAVINSGVVVARWDNGYPLVVRGTRAGRNLVALNMFPISSAKSSTWWSGDGANLMRNALLYSKCTKCSSGKYAAAGTSHKENAS